MLEVNYNRNLPIENSLSERKKSPCCSWGGFQCVKNFFSKAASSLGTHFGTSNSQEIADKKWTIQRKADVAFGILLMITGIALFALGVSSGFAPAGIVGTMLVLGGIGGIVSKGAPRGQFCS